MLEGDPNFRYYLPSEYKAIMKEQLQELPNDVTQINKLLYVWRKDYVSNIPVTDLIGEETRQTNELFIYSCNLYS